MGKELTTISPEGLEVANCYLQFGNIRAVVESLGVAENKVVELLNKREVKKYIDTVYLDMGYRNKNNIASLKGSTSEHICFVRFHLIDAPGGALIKCQGQQM